MAGPLIAVAGKFSAYAIDASLTKQNASVLGSRLCPPLAYSNQELHLLPSQEACYWCIDLACHHADRDSHFTDIFQYLLVGKTWQAMVPSPTQSMSCAFRSIEGKTQWLAIRKFAFPHASFASRIRACASVLIMTTLQSSQFTCDHSPMKPMRRKMTGL